MWMKLDMCPKQLTRAERCRLATGQFQKVERHDGVEFLRHVAKLPAGHAGVRTGDGIHASGHRKSQFPANKSAEHLRTPNPSRIPRRVLLNVSALLVLCFCVFTSPVVSFGVCG